MREIAEELLAWIDADRSFAVAIVVDTWSSAPRPVGSMMLLDTDGQVVGGLSGGCVEADVVARGERALSTGVPERAHYGVSDGDAMQVGLPCGGHIDVLVVPVDHHRRTVLRRVAEQVLADSSVALAVVIADVVDEESSRLGGMISVNATRTVAGTLGSQRLDDSVRDDAAGLVAAGRSDTLGYGPDAERLGHGLDVLVITHAPRPRMIIYGAIDHARALSRAARLLGHHVTICDARAMFATSLRFPEADEVVVQWPHRHLSGLIDQGVVDQRTVVIDLTHDLKFDIPLLRVALDPECPAGFVGAMGSQRTNERRRTTLIDEGMPEHWWDRLHAPVGLDLGARTAEETAISIVAEIIAHTWNGSGQPLRERPGPIHH